MVSIFPLHLACFKLLFCCLRAREADEFLNVVLWLLTIRLSILRNETQDFKDLLDV